MLDDSIAILDGMKTVLVVSSLVLLVMVGASTAQGQGAGGQQQEQNGQTTTAPNNGFTMDNNMMMMMMMIPMMKRKGDCDKPKTVLRNATACGAATARIVGGADTLENQIPWQCNLYYSDDSWAGCSGTIINCDPTIIVTSAYCAYMKPTKVTCGDWKIDSTDANEHTMEIIGLIQHPLFDYSTMNYDIAVVIVNGTMPCSKGKIWPACLPNKKKYAYEGWADTMVSGWGGIDSTDSTESNTLKYVKVPIVSDAACAATEPEYGFYPDTQNCAGLAAGSKGVCNGDIGGPLVTKATGVDTGYSLVGITSYDYGCATEYEPYGVFTEFSNFMEWVASLYGMTLK